MSYPWDFSGPAHQNTDDASPEDVLAAVHHCAISWEGDARIIGNVRAKDIARAIESILSKKESSDD